MFLFLSKLLPLLIYPLGLAIVLPIVGLIFLKRRRRRLASVLVTYVPQVVESSASK